MDREAFEKAENHQKNCVECISANEFSDSLGGITYDIYIYESI